MSVPPALLKSSDRTAVVTGGASGIGRATVERLRCEGARVVSVDLDAHDDGYQANVGLGPSIDTLYAHVQREVGPPDLLVAAAGVGVHERLDEGDPAKWQQVFETNVMGVLRLVRAFLPDMTGGDIVLVGSVAASRPYPSGGVYAASKAALAMVAETLRLETPGRVRITLISPGAVETGFFARELGGPRDFGGPFLDPSAIADAILYAITRPPGMTLDEIVIRPTGQLF